jgi:uncharacterized membrane protein
MIRKHPIRVISITALIAVAMLALSYPGRGDRAGAWYYISAIGWFGFLLSILAIIVFAVMASIHKRSTRTRPVKG